MPEADAEWLQADDLGGFASGTVDGIRTRRYHALLLVATTPPTGRVVLVNGMVSNIETASARTPLNAQRYAPDVVYPTDCARIISFTTAPWPIWRYATADDTVIEHEVFVATDTAETVLRWRRTAGTGVCRLEMRPLLSGRDYHALHRANPAFTFVPVGSGGNIAWRPYQHLPAIAALTNGDYVHEPEWYYNFLYASERDRGLDCTEDLAAPGYFTWDLTAGDAVIILRAGDGLTVRAASYAATLAEIERTRRTAVPALFLAAGSYMVDRSHGRSLLAGFPWFTDWGRDTFIALRGLAIATGRLAESQAILTAWAGVVSEGMVPNRFPDDGGRPEYNAVDASLWFIIAVHDFLVATRKDLPADILSTLTDAMRAIIEGYIAGTRFGIGMDCDGLLAAGVPGVQLTWMDSKCGDWVVTPRIGKPVEVQALWINALHIGALHLGPTWSDRWRAIEHHARQSFVRFNNPESGGLYDVIDADGVAGAVDASIRPNQIFAVGGLPFSICEGPVARAIVDLVERELLTPMGLRTLAPGEPHYQPHYRGDPAQRDSAYHQGTVWPWLITPFIDAWLRTRDTSTLANRAAAKRDAKARFIAPLLVHLDTAGLGHISEVADGAPPHTPGGCPFQAWSLGELIRALAMVEPSNASRKNEEP